MEWTKEHTIYLLQVLNDLQQQSKHPFHTIWESGTFTFKIFVWTRIILDRGLETSCCFSLWFANTLQMCAKITYYVKHVSLASQLQRECGGAKDASRQPLHNYEHFLEIKYFSWSCNSGRNCKLLIKNLLINKSTPGESKSVAVVSSEDSWEWGQQSWAERGVVEADLVRGYCQELRPFNSDIDPDTVCSSHAWPRLLNIECGLVITLQI